MELRAYEVRRTLLDLQGWQAKQKLVDATWKVLRWIFDKVCSDATKEDFEAKRRELEDTVNCVLQEQAELVEFQDSCPC